MEKLLVVTLHDAISSPNLAKGLSWMPRTCLAKSVGVPRPVVLSTSLKSLSFQALTGDASVMAMFLGECTSSSDPSSPVPSVVHTLYADATDRGTLAWVTKGLSKREFSRGLLPRPL